MKPQSNAFRVAKNRSFMISCCSNCPDRKVGCHIDCERYLSEKATRDEMTKENKKKEEIGKFFAARKRRWR